MSYHPPILITVLSAAFSLHVAFAAEPGEIFLRQKIPATASLIVTPGMIGDTQCSFIIDTGAQCTILDQSLMGLLTGSIGNGWYDDGSGRESPLSFFKIGPMKFQSLKVEKPIVAILDIRSVAKYLHPLVNGVMGLNCLSAGVLTVDNDQSVLEIHAAPWKFKDDSFTEIDLEDYIALPTFATYISDRYGQFLVDTGGLGNVSLERSLFTALVRNGSIEVSESNAHTLGASGAVEVRSGWFIKGELMGKSLVGMAVQETFGRSSIGIQWLYGFNFELDFKLHRFRYQQRHTVHPPASVYTMLGAVLVFGKAGPEVEKLNQQPNGAAQIAGLNPGDIIEEFGSLKAAEINYASVAELVTAKAGQAIPIQYIRKSDGERTRSTLQLPSLISPWEFAGRETSSTRSAP